MATALRSGSWNYEVVHSVTTSRRRSYVSCRANKQTARENGSTPTVPFNVATSVAVSLAATTLICSTDIAMAARVQGGDFGDLDLFSSAKTGVRFTEPQLKSPFGPSPPSEKEAPKVTKPLPPPPPAAASKERVKKQVPAKKPVAKSPQPTKPVQKAPPVQPPSKPSLSDLLKERRKEPDQKKIVPPTKPVPSPPKAISTPSVSLPTISTSSKDAIEAGTVVGIEILLALIASSTVSGLLKKA